MFTYEQSTGRFLDSSGNLLAEGYSGKGGGKNNPAMERVPDVGPIPAGLYHINPPIDTIEHGPFVLTLIPNEWNEMFDRGGFLIHGDSVEHPGEASEGCIVLPRPARERIAESLAGDNLLQVIP